MYVDGGRTGRRDRVAGGASGCGDRTPPDLYSQVRPGGGWEKQGAVSCAHWLSWRIGIDLPTAREKVRVARALGSLRAMDEALGRGELSYAKVRALTRVATPENELRLLELARHATGAQLERICRGYRQVAASLADEGPLAEERSLRERLLPGGMVRLELVVHPDEAALIRQAIEKARASLRERPQAVAPCGRADQRATPLRPLRAEGAPWPRPTGPPRSLPPAARTHRRPMEMTPEAAAGRGGGGARSRGSCAGVRRGGHRPSGGELPGQR